MQKRFSDQLPSFLFGLSIAFIIYMPLHVLIVQSASLATGGLEVWKAAKDVLLVSLVPLLVLVSYRQGLFKQKLFRNLMILGFLYTLIHGLFVLFYQSDDTYSAVVGSVYNTRLLGFLLLGYIVGSLSKGKEYLRYAMTAGVLVATLVGLFGVAQYFLPADLLESAGYTLERGVKPLFFIDDNPDLPRVMSTLKDPNSLGIYLVLPIIAAGWALFSATANKELFIRPFRRQVLAAILAIMVAALFLTFSRGALLSLIIATITLLYLSHTKLLSHMWKKFWYVGLLTVFVQDYVLHAAKTSNEQDPNQLRVSLQQQAINDVLDQPLGYGPGSAGLVSINNPQGGLLTENYYLQIAYEVGWLGIALFTAILAVIARSLYAAARHSAVSLVLLASLAGYLFYSLLIHLWSNEAVALQWWLLTGVVLASSVSTTKNSQKTENINS